MVLPGVGRHPSIGKTVVRPVRFAPVEVEGAHHHGGGAGQDARRIGGSIRIAVGELHPAMQPRLLALPQGFAHLRERLRPAHPHRTQPGPTTEIE